MKSRDMIQKAYLSCLNVLKVFSQPRHPNVGAGTLEVEFRLLRETELPRRELELPLLGDV